MGSDDHSTGGTKSYALTKSEREFLQTGETGGYRESTLNQRVQQKTVLLPERLERLKQDIELLAENERLDEEQGTEVWQDLLVKADGTQERDKIHAITELQGGIFPSTPAIELGRNVGKLLYHLVQFDDGSEWHDQIAHLVIGFIEGIYVDELSVRALDKVGIDGAVADLTDTVRGLSKEVESKREPATKMFESMRANHEKTKAFRLEAKQNVRKCLSEENVPGVEYTTLRDRMNEASSKEQSEGQEETEILTSETLEEATADSATSVAERTYAHLVAEEVEADGVPGTVQASLVFSSFDVSESSPDEFASHDRIMDVFERKRILGRIMLEKEVREDIRDLESQHWRGVEATEILGVVQEKEPISTDEIARNLDSRKSYTSQVTRLARALAGHEYELHDTWKTLPLLEGDKSGWQLTDYGEVVATYTFDYDSWTIDALPDSIVEQGIDELLDAEVLNQQTGV